MSKIVLIYYLEQLLRYEEMLEHPDVLIDGYGQLVYDKMEYEMEINTQWRDDYMRVIFEDFRIFFKNPYDYKLYYENLKK